MAKGLEESVCVFLFVFILLRACVSVCMGQQRSQPPSISMEAPLGHLHTDVFFLPFSRTGAKRGQKEGRSEWN